MALAALGRFRPQQSYALTVLAQGDAGAVFRAEPMGAGRAVVVKVGANRAAVARQFRRQRQVWRALKDTGHRVPRAMMLDADLPVMIMEHIAGQSLRALWSPPVLADVTLRAGAWLAGFHGISAAQRALETAPMLRWLDTLMSEPLAAARVRLGALATEAEGQAATYAVIHGDFHNANVMLTPGGDIVGIDFENAKPNLILRDIFLFLTDTGGVGGPAPLPAFMAGYGALDMPRAVLRFVDGYLATAAAARALNSGQSGPMMRARLATLLPIANGERGLLAPE